MEPPPPPRPMPPAGGGQATAAADARPKKPKAPARTKQGALASLEGGYIGLPATDAPLPGFAPAGGGARKVLPEWVLPFPLGIRPCAAEGTPLASSSVLWQALRQTRMMHMLQVLPPFSHRHRAGVEYYDHVPRELLPDLPDRAAHALVSLGRADVQAGPMRYVGVRFWHARRTSSPSAPTPLDPGFILRLQQRAEKDVHLQHLLQLARTHQLPPSGLAQLNVILAELMPPPLPPSACAPPVVLVEFPENPGVHFLLPLWHMAIERCVAHDARHLLLSFMIPAIGSKAAGESGKDEALRAVQGMLVRDVSAVPTAAAPEPAPPKAPAPRSRRATRSKSESMPPPRTPSPPPIPTRQHELFPLVWRITGPIDERLWDCFGRVPGALTNGTCASEQDEHIFSAIKASMQARMASMPREQPLPQHVPDADIPPGLSDHIHDKYAMRVLIHTSRPQPKRKVATLSDTREPARRHATERTSFVSTVDARGDMLKPKRKRHVATHNPDGTLKSCGACGKTKTPMWRRGPKGPSQLCNACGAKWKAGRLVVPDVPPPPLVDDVMPVRHSKPAAPSPAPSTSDSIVPTMPPVPSVPRTTEAPSAPPPPPPTAPSEGR